MALADNEKRDVVKLIEEGKPLPDEYRFKLFEEKREVELVWNGKTNEATNVVLPFQYIEHVDEPREEKDTKMQTSLFDFDERGRQIKGWTNKLIWGDNKLILSSLKNGPLREEIESNGGIKLIYIDPPFDVGADFSMDIEIGDETLTKEPTVLEELVYRDTWGKGADSFIAMIYERLSLMHDLLAEDGSIFVHCDYRLNSFIRTILDEIFGSDNFCNEIIWCYTGNSSPGQKQFPRKHDSIYWYSKSGDKIFNDLKIRVPYSEKTLANFKPGLKGSSYNENAYKEGQDKIGKIPEDWWEIGIAQRYPEDGVKRMGYPTEKPWPLLERIILASTNENDMVADFFVGSGLTAAVAESLGRKWIAADLGKYSIHTSRKRLINIQRKLKNEGKDYRAFEILNLGRYQRQYYTGISGDDKTLSQKEKQFVELIIKAYKAEKISGFKTFVAKKNARMVSIGPIDLPVTRLFVQEVIDEALEKQITKVDIIAFEFEMGLFPHIQEDARSKGIDLALKYIPPDVFDKRAIEKGQVVFYDVAYIEVKPHVKGNSVAIELTDFSVFYNQDANEALLADMKEGSNKVVVRGGQVIKITKDKSGILNEEILTKHWTDWIDYWAVDFNFENKKEIVKVLKKGKGIQQRMDGKLDPEQMELNSYEEKWTGDYIFENEWQSFRTKKNRNLDLTSVFKEVPKGSRKIAIKVVDIFGNDTMKVIGVNI